MEKRIGAIAGYMIRVFALTTILLTSWLKSETSIKQQDTYVVLGLVLLGAILAILALANWAGSNLRENGEIHSTGLYLIVMDLTANLVGMRLVVGKVYDLQEFRGIVFIHIIWTIVLVLLLRTEYISQREPASETS